MELTFWDITNILGVNNAIQLYEKMGKLIEVELLPELKGKETFPKFSYEQWKIIFETVLAKNPEKERVINLVFKDIFDLENPFKSDKWPLDVAAGTTLFKTIVFGKVKSMLGWFDSTLTYVYKTAWKLNPYVRLLLWNQFDSLPTMYKPAELLTEYQELKTQIPEALQKAAKKHEGFLIDLYMLPSGFGLTKEDNAVLKKKLLEATKQNPASWDDVTLVYIALTLPKNDRIRKAALLTLRQYDGPWEYWHSMLYPCLGDFFVSSQYDDDPRVIEIRELLIQKVISQKTKGIGQAIFVMERFPDHRGAMEKYIDIRSFGVPIVALLQKLDKTLDLASQCSLESYWEQQNRLVIKHQKELEQLTLTRLLKLRNTANISTDAFMKIIDGKIPTASKEETFLLINDYPDSPLILERVYQLASAFNTQKELCVIMTYLQDHHQRLVSRYASLCHREFYDKYIKKGWEKAVSQAIASNETNTPEEIIKTLCLYLLQQYKQLEEDLLWINKVEQQQIGDNLHVDVNSPREVQRIAFG